MQTRLQPWLWLGLIKRHILIYHFMVTDTLNLPFLGTSTSLHAEAPSWEEVPSSDQALAPATARSEERRQPDISTIRSQAPLVRATLEGSLAKPLIPLSPGISVSINPYSQSQQCSPTTSSLTIHL